jgi:hypothetical protein
MGMGDFTKRTGVALKEIFNINIIGRYGKSERFLDKIYKSVINLEYGASTVLART